MNKIKNLSVLLLALIVIGACEKKETLKTPETTSDEKTPEEASIEDKQSPIITINYPKEKLVISSVDNTVSVTYKLEVSDDVEIASVILMLDGKEMESYKVFSDKKLFKLENFTKGGLA